MRISGNAYHALDGHGVVFALNELPILYGPLGGGRDAILRPAVLDEAAHIFYEADRKTYGRTYEFVVGMATRPSPREYRIVVENREYQRTLSQLQHLVTSASRAGHAVRLKLWRTPPG